MTRLPFSHILLRSCSLCYHFAHITRDSIFFVIQRARTCLPFRRLPGFGRIEMSFGAKLCASLFVIVLGYSTMTFANSNAPRADSQRAPISKSEFGKLPDGTVIDAYTLHGGHGATVTIITYGAVITQLLVPDKSGKLGDVVLGFDKLESYVGDPHPYFGATI